MMIGVDAADTDFLRSHQGSLPTFRRLLSLPACREIRTTSSLLTGSVWPTFFTGRPPGEHGIYHHLQWDPAQMSLRRVSEDWLYAEPFWYDFERRGRTVTALDVPMTMPSRLERGVEILNWGSHDQLSPFGSNDRALARDVQRKFGRSHPMGAEIPVNKTEPEVRRIRDNLVSGARRKGELIRWLMEVRPSDFFVTAFGETHRGGHILWPEEGSDDSPLPPDALLDVYRAVDAALAEVITAAETRGATVVVFALHGMGPNLSQEHFVPQVMDRLRSAPSSTGQSNGDGEQRSLMRNLRERVPASWQNLVGQTVPVWVRDWVVTRQISSGYDWSETRCFPLLADYNGYLRWNRRGRERDGSLDASSQEQVAEKKRLISAWRNLRLSPDDAPLVAEVVEASEAFPGSRTDYLPDLIVTWAPEHPATTVESDQIGRIEATLATGRGGNHRHTGFFTVLGDGADAMERVEVNSIEDLSRLAAAIAGIP